MIGTFEEKPEETAQPSNGARIDELEARVKELMMENTSLKSLIKEEYDKIELADKIRLKLLLRLMEKDGADLDNYGNKANAAKVIQLVTGLPPSTCKNYCTNRDLNTDFHAEPISKLNHVLEELEMGTRL